MPYAASANAPYLHEYLLYIQIVNRQFVVLNAISTHNRLYHH